MPHCLWLSQGGLSLPRGQRPGCPSCVVLASARKWGLLSRLPRGPQRRAVKVKGPGCTREVGNSQSISTVWNGSGKSPSARAPQWK